MNIPREIAVLLKIDVEQVLNTIALLNEDATVPFIARYRKEKTGGLDEEQIKKYVTWQINRDRNTEQPK